MCSYLFKTCSNVFKHVQTCSKLVQMCSNMFKLVQNSLKCVQMCSNLFKTCSNVFKLVQNPFKCVQTCSNLFKTCSNVFKCVQNCSKFISLSSARGPTWQAELDLVFSRYGRCQASWQGFAPDLSVAGIYCFPFLCYLCSIFKCFADITDFSALLLWL